MYLYCEPRTFAQGVLLLKANGHAVIASMDPAMALRVLAVEPVTLVIVCDSLEPGTRNETVKAMRAIRPEVRIVLLAKDGQQHQRAARLFDLVLPEHDDSRIADLLAGLDDNVEEQ